MKNFSFLTAFFLIGLALFWTSVPTGCANIIPPLGGPKDSLPPVLLESDPADSTLNFNEDRITLTFDEYIDLNDVPNNVFFTPTFETNPVIAARGKSIIISFKEGQLLPNTTYVIDFGKSIVDVNENNVLNQLIYTFSTGPVFDSLELSGRVLLAETGGIDSTLLVYLHRDLSDSAVVAKKAPYLSRVDRNGYFRFRFLPAERFAIYAIGGQQSKDRRYSATQLFAFADSSVVAGQADSILLYAYSEPLSRQASAAAGRIPANDMRLRYTINTTTGQQDLLQDLVINFPVPLKNFDSTRIQLSTDSLFTPVNFSAAMDTSRQMVTIKTEWQDSTNYNLVLDREFATDTAGRQLLKTDTLFLTTMKKSDYGSLNIRFRNLDFPGNPVLQFVQNNVVVNSFPLNDAVFNRELFTPGEYNLRILLDSNGDNKWTPGSFFGVKRQPEIVMPVERTINVKASWKNEFEIPL